jgi:hypothetical protein
VFWLIIVIVQTLALVLSDRFGGGDADFSVVAMILFPAAIYGIAAAYEMTRSTASFSSMEEFLTSTPASSRTGYPTADWKSQRKDKRWLRLSEPPSRLQRRDSQSPSPGDSLLPNPAEPEPKSLAP